MRTIRIPWEELRELSSVRAILAYVEWYRKDNGIKIGSRQVGGDDMGWGAQMIEMLAREEVGRGFWLDLSDDKTRFGLYVHAAAHVATLLKRRVKVPNWPAHEPWQLTSHVLDVLYYVWEFRFVHQVDLNNPREFRYDDLGPMGELIIGKLVTTPEFTGEWVRLADPVIASEAALLCRMVKDRLERYRLRRLGAESNA